MGDGTTTLLVRGLNTEGPHDIVGTFVNEANVDPNAIGVIDIEDGEAAVEVRAGLADRVHFPFTVDD